MKIKLLKTKQKCLNVLLLAIAIPFSCLAQKGALDYKVSQPQIRISGPTSPTSTTLELAMSSISSSPNLQTEILIDKVNFNEILAKTNGVTGYSSITMDDWLQIMYSLNHSDVNGSNIYENYQVAMNEINYGDTNFISLGLINYEYDKIKDNAYEDGLLNMAENGVIYEDPDIGISPFDKKLTFALSAMHDKIYENSINSFVLDERFFITNRGSTLSNITIDFDDGNGPQYVEFNKTYTVKYKKQKYAKLTINAKDLNYSKVQGVYYVALRCSDEDPPEQTRRIGNPVYSPFIATLHTLNTGNSEKDPILFIEGYDLYDTKDYREIKAMFNSNTLIDQLNPNFYLHILDFKRSVTGAYITPSMEDYVYLVKAAIDSIENKITSDKKLTIIGAGVGGLAARLALGQIEVAGKKSQTELFITVDCPHQGANIPLAYQYWIDNLASGNALANKENIIINSNIMKEILRYHRTGVSGDYIEPTNKRTALIDELILTGNFVEGIRNVVISNGTTVYHGDLGIAGEKILDYNKNSPMYNQWAGHLFNLPNCNSAYEEIFYDQHTYISQTNIGKVEVKHTLPFDVAPGSKVNFASSLNFLAATINVTNGYQCFVPTISALNYEDENDLFASVNPNTIPGIDTAYYNTGGNREHLDFSGFVTTEILNEIYNLYGLYSGSEAFKTLQNENIKIDAMPNPNFGIFNIEDPKIDIGSKIQILNSLGQTVAAETYFGNSLSFNIASQPKGLYFIKYFINNKPQIQKMIKN